MKPRRVKDLLRARQDEHRPETNDDYGRPPATKDEQIREVYEEDIHGRPRKHPVLPPLVRKFRIRNL